MVPFYELKSREFCPQLGTFRNRKVSPVSCCPWATFHQLSELLPVKGIDIIGPLPPELQYLTVFSGAIHSATTERSAASALIAFLTAPAAREVLKHYGLEPG